MPFNDEANVESDYEKYIVMAVFYKCLMRLNKEAVNSPAKRSKISLFIFILGGERAYCLSRDMHTCIC